MELSEKDLKELEDRITNKVIDNIKEKYILVPKFSEHVEEMKKKLGVVDKKECGCADHAVLSETGEKVPLGAVPSLPTFKPLPREIWKQDEQIYDPKIEDNGDPEVFSIMKYVTLDLIHHIECVYQVHASLLVIEEYLMFTLPAWAASVANEFSSRQLGASPSGPPLVPLLPHPRYGAPCPVGPYHYFIGNPIPDS